MTTKEKYKKVAYYPGCALEGTGHSYNRSTKACLLYTSDAADERVRV